MFNAVTLAIDAMGGDAGPAVTVAGAALSLVRHPQARFILVGDEAAIEAQLALHPPLRRACRVIHTTVAVAMDAKPSQALREGRTRSSMWLALDCVKRGEAQAAVSAGNTGALMAMAKFCLKTLPGIDRPAIAAVWPTVAGETVVLDMGANVGADARQLVEFAGMGAAMARAMFGVARPRVGLLNIGVEEVKGLDEIKRAGAALRTATDLPIVYHGFVEGDDIGQGIVDVVVTEGFAGNIALKTAEGTARQIGTYLRAAMTRSLMARIGAVFAQGAFRALKDKMDPRALNGGIFVGLKGVVIKSHGGTDRIGFASAVDLGYDMARRGLTDEVARDVSLFQAALTSDAPAATPLLALQG